LKKYLAIILGALFVLSFAASAFAIHAEIPSETQAVVATGTTQINLSGELRVRGWYGKNIDGAGTEGFNGLPTETSSAAWYDERVRLSVDAKISPNIEGMVQLESGTGDQDNYTWGNFNSKPTQLDILQAWMMYSGSGLLGFPSGIKVGHMPLALGQKEFFDHTKFGDDAIVAFLLPTKEMEIDLLTIKFAGDGNPFVIPTGYYSFNNFDINATGSKLVNTQDLDGYVGILTYKVDPKTSVGLNYTFLNQSALGFSHQDLGVTANADFAGLGVKATGDFQFGKVKAVDEKFRGWAVTAGLNYMVDPLNLRASFAYGSGDNNANDGKDKQFETYLGDDQHYTLVYEYQVVSTAGRINSGIANTTYYNIGLDVTPVKDVTASLDGYLIRATKTADSISKDAGWEVDGKVVYNIAKNLTYQVDAGYFKAGSYYADAYPVETNGDKKGATVLRHMLTLSF
jgi:Alginate export